MDFNEYDNNGRTPLMNAAITGDYDEVKRLIEYVANPNITDDNFSTSKAAAYSGPTRQAIPIECDTRFR